MEVVRDVSMASPIYAYFLLVVAEPAHEEV